MARNIGADTGNKPFSIENQRYSCEISANCHQNPFGFERKFAIINNRKISYFSVGSGAKTIVFLHGWGSDASAFFFAMKQLCVKYRVIAVDLAGFGQSDNPPDRFGVKEYAEDVVELMKYLHVDEATFAGHSFGGRVSIELAAYYPRIAKRIVLIDSAGLKPRRKPSYYCRVFIHKMLKKFGKSGLKGSSDYRALPDCMKRVFIKVVNYNQKPLLVKIQQPCAVFWGSNDLETPLYMYNCFLKNIKRAQGFLLDGGHFAFVEDRIKFCLILTAYLNETDELLQNPLS